MKMKKPAAKKVAKKTMAAKKPVRKMKVGGMSGDPDKPKVQTTKGVTVKTGPNKYSKETITSTRKDGSQMIYEASKNGKVTSLKTTPKSASAMSMDTTGYSKGKPNYTLEMTSPYKVTKTTVARKDVVPTLNSMKKEVGSYKKKGGKVVTRKKK